MKMFSNFKDKETVYILVNQSDFNGVKNFLDQHQTLLLEDLSPFTDLTLLMYACRYGLTEVVEHLLFNYSNILNVNFKTKYGETALYYAVEEGSIDYIRLLLSHPNIDVHLPCGDFDKPVLWYCGNRECYDLLLPYYTTINEYDKKMAWLWYLCRSSGLTDTKEVKDLIHAIPRDTHSQMRNDVSVMVLLAATSGKADIIEHLLSSYGDLIDVNIQDKDGQTPLYQAGKKGSLESVKLLLSHPNINAIINSEYQLSHALYLAVFNSHVECVKALLGHPNIQVNETVNLYTIDISLSLAVSKRSVDCLKELLSHPKINVDLLFGDELAKPLLWCCGNRECYDLLLPRYPSLKEYEKKMAWVWCSIFVINYENDNLEELRSLMKDFSHNITVEMKKDISEMVLLSVSRKKPNILKYLLENYSDIIDINIKDKKGNTALLHAVQHYQLESLRLLLSHPNIDVNILYGDFDKTVLWYCHTRESYDLLLPHYPNMKEYEKKMAWLWYLCGTEHTNEMKKIVNTIPRDVLSEMRNDVSMMVLIAAARGRVEIIEFLLSSYSDLIDVNIQDKWGRTSLHRAIFYNKHDCISILANVVDQTIKDKNEKTALELVRSKVPKDRFSLDVNQTKVKWNRCKIMLVGQGRAGKTALANNLAGKWMGETESTIGAEQMDMQLFYGEVQGGRLEEYERPKQEFEALLAERYHYDNSRVNAGVTSHDDISNSEIPPLPRIATTTKINSNFTSSFNLRDINSDAVGLHYRKLQELNTASSCKLILVDFGGQSIFNVLHAFFMSKHGIYLVVFDMELFLSNDAAKQESCRKELQVWLNSITMYTSIGTEKIAPVAIVGTRGDKISTKEEHKRISKELNRMFEKTKAWQSLMWFERDGERLSFFPNDNTQINGNTVSQELLKSIEKSLKEVESIRREIPFFWIKIFDEMKGLRRSHLSLEDVVTIARKRLTEEGGRDDDQMNWEMIKIEVREMLRFLNDIGMLMWIEESGLEDVIILDPIGYLVKPATTIICKHLATKDDPYKTKHEIPEVHGACKKAHHDDWMRMLESGLVSDKLARDILTRYYQQKNRLLVTNIQDNLEKVLQMMIKFSLMVPLFPPSAPIDSSQEKRNHYIVPSLLPSAPLLQNTEDEDDYDLEMLFRRLHAKYHTIEEKWNDIGMQYSLYYFLPLDGLSTAKIATKSACYAVISSSELSTQGFLPQSLFERLICRFIQDIIRHEDIIAMDQLLIDNELITGFRGKVQFPYRDHNIRMIERQEENRIEVIIQSHELADKEKEKEIFQEIHKRSVEVMEGLLNECYEGLLVKTLLHLPSPSSGFVTLERVRSLLASSDQVKPKRLNSYDGTCQKTFVAEEMKKDPYWSVWKEKEMIPPLLLDSSLPSSQLPLTAGKKTHVFLSHDWGIDGNNHNRVKQVSEALKSRGLITWIDDERIVNEIDEKIIDGLNHTMGLAVFVTENYVKKLNSGNHQDYCKKEFHYGIKKLTPQKMIFIVLDKAMKDQNKWSDSMTFNLPSSILYFDLSEIFEQSSNLSENSVKEKMDNLSQKIATVLELESVSKENDQKSDEVSADNDQGGLLTVKSFCFCCVILFVMTFLIYSVLRV